VRFRIAIVSGLAVSAAAAALGALLMMEKLPSVAKDDSPEAASFDARFIVDITAGPTNEEALLGQALRGRTADHVAATRTTVGASPTQPANQEALLGEALRGTTADDVASTTTEGASHTGPAKQEAPFGEALRGTTADDVASTASPTARAPDPSEIAVLVKRGQELMSSGDIAAARVLLLRAAEAGDPKAALALAATFDPIMLKKSGVYGVLGDVSSARSWYEKAKEFGSKEALQRLEIRNPPVKAAGQGRLVCFLAEVRDHVLASVATCAASPSASSASGSKSSPIHSVNSAWRSCFGSLMASRSSA
jgi:hypothetical protein